MLTIFWETIFTELRLLILEHKSIVYTILSWEVILTVNVLKSILLFLILHLVNLSLQIGNFFVFSVLLSETILINFNIISWLWKSVWISLFWIFCLWKMFWEIVKKLVIFIIILILYFSSSSSEFFIRRIIAFSKISVIWLKSRKDN